MRFNQDRTYEDNSGSSGVWSVQGDILTIVGEDGLTIQWQYFVDGRRPDDHPEQGGVPEHLQQREGTDEIDPETAALLDILFGDGDLSDFSIRPDKDPDSFQPGYSRTPEFMDNSARSNQLRLWMQKIQSAGFYLDSPITTNRQLASAVRILANHS